MHCTPDDIRSRFDHTTYNRGADYHRRDMVLEARVDGGTIRGKVRGSSAGHYRQVVKLVTDGRHVDFQGDCSCPVEYNCKPAMAACCSICARDASRPTP